MLTVKAAFAENFIIKKGLGKKATPQMLREIQRQEEEDRKNQEELLQKAKQDAQTLELVFAKAGAFVRKKCGPDGSIFGSVTNADLAEMIADQAGVIVDKKNIVVEPVSKVGASVADVRLHKQVPVKLKFNVIPLSL